MKEREKKREKPPLVVWQRHFVMFPVVIGALQNGAHDACHL